MLHWEEFTKIATKLEVFTERYLFSVVLFSDYLTNCLTAFGHRHFHANYEVLYFHRDSESSFFRIVPPGLRHMGAQSAHWQGYYLTTFQFNITDHFPGASSVSSSVLDAYGELQQPVDIPDTFDGNGIMKRIRDELQHEKDACFEHVSALFQLLLIELALALPYQKPKQQKVSQNTVDDFRAIYVEYFLNRNYKNPECSRAQLAELLGVCERHLVRILDRIFHTTFRELLTEHRMEAAESWRVYYGLSAEETAARVGYGSCKGFLKAYQRYHGRPFKRTHA